MQLQHAPATLAANLNAFAAISLAELDEVALLERVDTKFALSGTALPGLLEGVAPQYRVLEIDGRRIHDYETLYFDTDDFLFYRAHRSGRRIRHKVRSRRYLDSGLSFFEVKSRAGEYRTVKSRLSTEAFVTTLDDTTRAFASEYAGVPGSLLAPRITNRFSRITLASFTSFERVTVDTDISLAVPGRTITFPGLAIVEVKRESHHALSAFASALRERYVRPTAFSKYCVGVASLLEEPRHNTFKPTLRMVSRILESADA
jgi:hypothetical protein